MILCSRKHPLCLHMIWEMKTVVENFGSCCILVVSKNGISMTAQTFLCCPARPPILSNKNRWVSIFFLKAYNDDCSKSFKLCVTYTHNVRPQKKDNWPSKRALQGVGFSRISRLLSSCSSQLTLPLDNQVIKCYDDRFRRHDERLWQNTFRQEKILTYFEEKAGNWSPFKFCRMPYHICF